MLVIYGVLLPLGLFGLETLALTIWLHYTSEPKQNKLTKKGKTNGR
jgi:hypothetical protein